MHLGVLVIQTCSSVEPMFHGQRCAAYEIGRAGIPCQEMDWQHSYDIVGFWFMSRAAYMYTQSKTLSHEKQEMLKQVIYGCRTPHCNMNMAEESHS